MPGILEKVVSRILLKPQVVIPDNPPGKVYAFEWQREDHGKQSKWGDAPQFSDPIAMQQGSDLEISHKGGDPVLELYCFLLIQVLFGIVHVSLSSLILLDISQIPLYQKAKGFSR